VKDQYDSPVPENSAELRLRIALTLKEFSAEPDDALGAEGFSTKPSPELFPVPELALFVLRDLMGFKSFGRGEKVRWTVVCAFRGYPSRFELRKFGFTVMVGGGQENVTLALGALKKAMKLAEPLLRDLAQAQALHGNVTLSNRMGAFDGRYRYLREKAALAYGTGDLPKPSARSDGDDSQGIDLTGLGAFLMKSSRATLEGYWLAAAMVDAFFSRLEHQLVLLLAFTDFDPADGRLVHVIRSDWDDKFKTVFNIVADKLAKKNYDALKTLKEKTRNPEAHGGFEKGWHSLYFHMPNIGALPGNLLDFSKSNEFKLIPIEREDYNIICKSLDDIDGFIAQRLPLAMRYLTETGLSVYFDGKSREEFRNAMKDDTTFSEFLEYSVHMADMHSNMDY